MIIDASVWVAAVLEQDAHHASTREFVRRFVMQGGRAKVPLLAWIEIAGAVSRRTGDTHKGLRAAHTLASQTWIEGVALDALLAHESTRLAATQRLRGADAVYVALAASLNQPLLTLDNELLERTQGVIEALTPAQWLARQ